MSRIAEILFMTLVLVIASGVIIGLIIAVDERKNFKREMEKLDK
jgi:hypothetical protein